MEGEVGKDEKSVDRQETVERYSLTNLFSADKSGTSTNRCPSHSASLLTIMETQGTRFGVVRRARSGRVNGSVGLQEQLLTWTQSYRDEGYQ
jgi:hypothetical protein